MKIVPKWNPKLFSKLKMMDKVSLKILMQFMFASGSRSSHKPLALFQTPSWNKTVAALTLTDGSVVQDGLLALFSTQL